MTARPSHSRFACLLLLSACVDPPSVPAEESSTGSGPGTTSPSTTLDSSPGDASTAVDSTSSEPPETSGGLEMDCHDDRVIPPAPVDCSGASMSIDGSVLIEEGDDPSILEGVVEVSGAIRINRTDLANLDFMACVRKVGADVTIFGNDQLTNVDGLWSLTDIGTELVFSQNDALVDFDGLPNLESVAGSVTITENASLETVTGFHTLVRLDGMGVDENGNLSGGNLLIRANPVLQHIDGFGEMKVINGVFGVTNNPALCISSVICVVEGIVQPSTPPDSWSTVANDGSC